jgi:hypothetical protein
MRITPIWKACLFELEMRQEFAIISPESKEPAMRSSSATISLLLACALITFSARAAIHYVDVNSTNAVAPYISWDTAAVTIQDAVDASAFGDRVIVTNGVYNKGGKVFGSLLTNRVTVTIPMISFRV